MGTQDNEAETSAPAADSSAEDDLPSPGVKKALGLVVGIGASAGGLEAYRALFSAMPPDTGMSFVLVQHLDPNHVSALPEILRRSTRMAVSEAKNGDRVAPNHIHIVPPNATLTIKAGILQVSTPASLPARRASVDIFLSSLAEDRGENAVGIILSGFGSDGRLGMEAIKERGGLTLAQGDFDHAAQAGMPESAAAAGFVDHVLPVEKMPEVLQDYLTYRSRIDPAKDSQGLRQDMGEHLNAICAILDNRLGRDFSQYKTNTLLRRIQRRMQVLRIDDVADYVEKLRERADEPGLLFQELLIRVTRFFRDPAAFEALAERLPALIARENGRDAIRVWVPGCATGEEAYSIAILLKEAMLRCDHSRRVQIFATDVDGQAIDIARSGLYPDTIALDVPADLLNRYFVQEGSRYRVSKTLREMCLFSIHDLVKDPPFSHLDIISCRNLLIYFGPELQKRVANRFHYGLVDSGILFLGASEAVTAHSTLFKPEDKKRRLFSRRNAPARLLDIALRTRKNSLAGKPANWTDSRIAQVVARYAPAFAIIDRHQNILQMSGPIGKYLSPASGVVSLNLSALIHPDLAAPLRAALAQVDDGKRRTRREGVVIEQGGLRESVNIDVELLELPDPQSGGRLMVAFQDLGISRPAEAAGSPSSAEGLSPADELISARERLQTLREELDASTEELQSSNEEYLAINEELQSANEELETSTEELQSVNEELATLNAELSTRNENLIDLNSDLVNLIDSTSIATLFLDRALRIKRFTPALLDIFRVREGDQGRPITDIVSKLAEKGLQADAEQVLRTLVPTEREVSLESGERAYQMQVRPYRNADDVVNGVVITFIDVTERKRVEFDRAQLAAIVSSSDDAIIGHGLDGTITSWNTSAERLLGYQPFEMIGLPMTSLFPEARIAAESALSVRLARGEGVSHHEAVLRAKDSREIDVSQSISPVRGVDGAIVGAARIIRDNTQRRRADAEKALLLGELDHRVKNILATVSSVVRQTLHTSGSPESFVKSIEGRIQALTRAHGLLTRDGTGQGSLKALLTTELDPYDEHGTRVQIDGPEVTLTPKVGLVMAMAIHELATNAAKHGALSVSAGRLSVTWRIIESAPNTSTLRVEWEERDGPPVVPPKRLGFGSALIERALHYEFDAEVTRTFAPTGLTCVMELPLTDEVIRIAGTNGWHAGDE
jgi:two-component system CheB/CheR fusion protein